MLSNTMHMAAPTKKLTLIESDVGKTRAIHAGDIVLEMIN